MAIQFDPDVLTDTVDVVIDTSAKTIEIKPYNASTNASGVILDEGATGGVTGQCLYSWLKEEWKTNSNYIKFPFPMEAITPEQFEFLNDWKPKDDASRKLIRSAGWAEKSTAGAVLREYAGIVSLGSLGAADQPYYQFNTETAVNFTYPGPVNEAVQIFGDASNGNIDFNDAADTFKIFCREQGKTYAASNKAAIGATSLNYIVYRFPLSNGTDLKIASYATDLAIASAPTVSTTSWSGGVLTINTSAAHNFTVGVRIRITSASNASYDGVYTVATVPTSTQFTVAKASDPGAWGTGTLRSIYSAITVEYFGTNQLFDVDGDTVTEPYRYIITDASGQATTAEIYQKIQYQLRQNSDIDSGAGSVIGKVADSLLSFLGDTLVGASGVYISGLNTNFINSVDFYDFNGVVRRYPFVAAGTINFGQFAGSGDFKYWMFFTTTPNNSNYGTASALVVNKADGTTPITGTYAGSPVNWDFAYDSNTQGGRTVSPAGNVNVKVIGIGLSGGQFVSVDHVITRSAGQSILLAPAQERNYNNPV